MSGDTAAGVALVIQGPGWGPPVDYLRETLAPRLAARRPLVHEIRNTGRSRPDPPRSHRFDDLVDDLVAAVRRAGLGSHAIIAHSHGARIAAGYALRSPSGLERMVWITPGLDGREPPAEAAPLLARLERRPGGEAAARAIREGPGPDPDDRALARWSRRVLPGLFAASESRERFLRAVRRAPPPSADAYRGVRRDPGPDPDRWAEIEVPLLLISGRHDPLAPPASIERHARRLPRARHEVFERSAHHPWFEEPERFDRVVDEFLSGGT